MGDGIFVVFGAPKDVPDHATMAVKCAVEMQNALKGVNEWNIENGFPEFEMGIGINTGKAVVGNIGSEKKMKYGCMGSVVNIAGRLESLTIGGQVFITDNTRKLISDNLTIKSEGSFLPKGSPEELKYYEIDGIGDISRIDDSSGEIIWNDKTEETGYDFYILEAKKVEETIHKGSVIKVSQNGRFAFFVPDIELQEKQNIMLRKNDECIYAKVIKKVTEGFVICFTSMTQTLNS